MEAERIRMREQAEAIERQRLQDVARMDAERAEIRREQEQLRREAEERVDVERQRVFAEQRAAEEAARLARLEALKPEIEKAGTFFKAIDNWADSYLATVGAPWADSALVSIDRACIEIRKNVERGEW